MDAALNGGYRGVMAGGYQQSGALVHPAQWGSDSRPTPAQMGFITASVSSHPVGGPRLLNLSEDKPTRWLRGTAGRSVVTLRSMLENDRGTLPRGHLELEASGEGKSIRVHGAHPRRAGNVVSGRAWQTVKNPAAARRRSL